MGWWVDPKNNLRTRQQVPRSFPDHTKSKTKLEQVTNIDPKYSQKCLPDAPNTLLWEVWGPPGGKMDEKRDQGRKKVTKVDRCQGFRNEKGPKGSQNEDKVEANRVEIAES